MLADGNMRVPGGNHLANRQSPHYLADANWRDVGSALVHPATHGRVKRYKQYPDQQFAFVQLANRLFLVGPVRALRYSNGAGSEGESVIDKSPAVFLSGQTV